MSSKSLPTRPQEPPRSLPRRSCSPVPVGCCFLTRFFYMFGPLKAAQHDPNMMDPRTRSRMRLCKYGHIGARGTQLWLAFPSHDATVCVCVCVCRNVPDRPGAENHHIFSSGCLPSLSGSRTRARNAYIPINFLFKSAHVQLRLPSLIFRDPGPSQKCLHFPLISCLDLLIFSSG